MNDFPLDLREYLVSNGTPTSGSTARDASLLMLYAKIAERLYYSRMEAEAAFPKCAFEVGVEVPINTFDGSSSVAQAEIQIYIAAKNVSDMRTIGNALVAALHNFKGTMGSSTVGLIVYQGDNQDYDDATGVYYMTLKFKLLNEY